MKSSLVIKKIIQIVVLGVALLIGYGSFLLYYYMGKTFGYKDLGKQSYIETSAFADNLWGTMYRLNNDAEQMNSYRIPRGLITLHEMEMDSLGNCLIEKEKKNLTYRDFIEQGEYEYNTSENGIEEVLLRAEDDYAADWYIISLDDNTIANNNEYSTVTKEEYINLMVRNGMPNAKYVADMTLEEVKKLLDGNMYQTAALQEDYERYVDSHPELNNLDLYAEEGDGSDEGMLKDYEKLLSTGIHVNDFSEIDTVYIDNNFSDDCYILWVNDIEVIYSPNSDMFYSSLYGWYSVPNVLYFPAIIYGEYVSFDGAISEYMDTSLFLFQFTDRNSLLRNKIGEDYLEYVRAKKDLEYIERNICYYTVSNGNVYENVAEKARVTGCNQYIVIRKTDSGEFKVELHNFNNVYMTDTYAGSLIQNMTTMVPDEEMYIGVYTTYPFPDQFSFQNDVFVNYYKYTVPAMITSVISLIISCILFIHISRHAGRAGRDDEKIYLNPLDRWPVEIMIMLGIGSAMVALSYIQTLFRSMQNLDIGRREVAVNSMVLLLGYFVCMTVYLSLLRRGKARQFFEKSIFRWIYRLVKRAVHAFAVQRNLVARTIEAFVGYWLAMFIGLSVTYVGMRVGRLLLFLIGLSILIGVNVITLVVEVRQAKGEEMIRMATETLASGNLDAEMPQGKPLATEAYILGNIEHLSDGLQKAVEKSIYDERMKAELITNVSHDIKTPLTSIINYVDLIKREKIDNDKVNHYIEVLDQKSHRLKQLTEDLVEISKISSGNIELECMPIDLGELVRQSIGEFEDKFAANNLQIIVTIPEQPIIIYADGRRTFRVMDNLLQNIYKYAMPNTRVYVDLKAEDGNVELLLKNISKSALNIDVKELMERFVRGDQSRSTEGSGLGLSIAGDLIRIQGGTFDIVLDGDLFKVMIVFPIYVPEVKKPEGADAVIPDHENIDAENTDAQNTNILNADVQNVDEQNADVQGINVQDADEQNKSAE